MKYALLLCVLSFMWICSSFLCGWSKAPDAAKIVFTSNRDRNREIYLMNPDGSQPIRLTDNPADDLYPIWSPTGEHILFISNRSGQRDLYLMDADGKNPKRVFIKSRHRDNPTWSPDSKQIAYERVEQEDRFIYIATANGKNEEQVAKGRDPDWSPDGTQIAFTKGGLGGSQIVLLDVNTRTEKRLIPDDGKMLWMSQPAWSAIGGRIAFVWNKNPLPDPPDPWPPEGWLVPPAWLNKETIYVVNRDGTTLERIVEEAGPPATSPVWALRDEELIYTQKINNFLQLFKIDLATQTPKQLTHSVVLFQENRLADWFDPAYALPVSPQPQLLTTTWGEVKKR